MKKTGDVFSGFEGLSISLVVATVVLSPFGLLGSGNLMSYEAISVGLGLAVLVPLVPYTLEMLALRRLPVHFFGMFMSVEPMISVVVAWIILNESLTILQLFGVALVTIAMLKVSQLASHAP